MSSMGARVTIQPSIAVSPTASCISPEGTGGPVSKLGLVSMFACADAESAAASAMLAAAASLRSGWMTMTSYSPR